MNVNIRKINQRYLVNPGRRVSPEDWDADDDALFPAGKDKAAGVLKDLREQLDGLQELLYAERKHKVLIVLQGMDTAGKDSTVRHIFEGVNPQGVRVACFKAPSADELSRDYLWRVHRQVPARGEIVVFNRSHYEDIVAVGVQKLAPPDVWQKRYRHLVQFERMLADEGVLVLKIFLHISRAEQKKRLKERLEDPRKHWKFEVEDLEKRKRWNIYMRAYGEVLSRTSAECAPWFVIPANRKWYRDLLIARLLVSRLEGLKMRFPALKPGLKKIVIP
ncbi:MAG: polyphosphate kinase 2 family protein [Candidatus Omnitrophota bacterium]|nr:polyphosphate kinase 2 family protein [Candidatus Omnitrophota bacterium]MDZ4243229.1 PPK2 family polyphosphate kinase [Candidatus Omnitrophota bacterium]